MPHPLTPNNVIRLKVPFKRHSNRKQRVQDYLSDYHAAMSIVKSLEKYYHSRGYPKVKAWLEKQQLESGRTMYNVRSNIVFNTPKD